MVASSLRTSRRPTCHPARDARPPPRPEVFEAYWSFALERQRIFEARLSDRVGPWTDDPILATHRFCNTFRASDRVSQDLIRVAYESPSSGPPDLFVRVVLHRLFSRPTTWRLLDVAAGGLTAATFDPDALGAVLDEAHAAGEKLYTGAFILCANRAFGHARKHRNHLALVQGMLEDGVPARIEATPSFKGIYDELRQWPLLGPFMAYQLAIDLNYTTIVDFDEDEFTVPGPGALRGLRKVFVDLGGLTLPQAVHWLVRYQERVEEELGIEPPRLFGRRLKAIDCQNLLCEVDKYSRVRFPELRSNRNRIKQRFTPDPTRLDLFYPPKWGINAAAAAARHAIPRAQVG
ncbi:MAG: nucleotide kinase domain-containing protein [Thermoleophilaceae bacterium]